MDIGEKVYVLDNQGELEVFGSEARAMRAMIEFLLKEYRGVLNAPDEPDYRSALKDLTHDLEDLLSYGSVWDSIGYYELPVK